MRYNGRSPAGVWIPALLLPFGYVTLSDLPSSVCVPWIPHLWELRTSCGEELAPEQEAGNLWNMPSFGLQSYLQKAFWT